MTTLHMVLILFLSSHLRPIISVVPSKKLDVLSSRFRSADGVVNIGPSKRHHRPIISSFRSADGVVNIDPGPLLSSHLRPIISVVPSKKADVLPSRFRSDGHVEDIDVGDSLSCLHKDIIKWSEALLEKKHEKLKELHSAAKETDMKPLMRDMILLLTGFPQDGEYKILETSLKKLMAKRKAGGLEYTDERLEALCRFYVKVHVTQQLVDAGSTLVDGEDGGTVEGLGNRDGTVYVPYEGHRKLHEGVYFTARWDDHPTIPTNFLTVTHMTSSYVMRTFDLKHNRLQTGSAKGELGDAIYTLAGDDQAQQTALRETWGYKNDKWAENDKLMSQKISIGIPIQIVQQFVPAGDVDCYNLVAYMMTHAHGYPSGWDTKKVVQVRNPPAPSHHTLPRHPHVSQTLRFLLDLTPVHIYMDTQPAIQPYTHARGPIHHSCKPLPMHTRSIPHFYLSPLQVMEKVNRFGKIFLVPDSTIKDTEIDAAIGKGTWGKKDDVDHRLFTHAQVDEGFPPNAPEYIIAIGPMRSPLFKDGRQVAFKGWFGDWILNSGPRAYGSIPPRTTK